MPKRKPAEKNVGEIPIWSWVLASLGLALVAGSAGFLLYEAFAGDTSPPDLVIEAGDAVPGDGGYLVPIRVINRGGLAAAGVEVEGVLQSGNVTEETSSTTIDYVPAGSEREAGLLFRKDPREFKIEVQAKGFLYP